MQKHSEYMFITSIVAILIVAVALSGEEKFEWKWLEELEPGKTEKKTEEPKTPPAPSSQPSPRRDLTISEYERLVKENLELRSKLDAVTKEKEDAIKRREALSAELVDREQKIKELTSAIQELKNLKAIIDAEKAQLNELKSRAENAERERAQLADQLATTKNELETLRRHLAEKSVPAVTPSTDLFKQVEQENVTLREKLARSESERKKLETAVAELTAKNKELESAVKMRGTDKRSLEEKLAQAQTSESIMAKELAKTRDEVIRLQKELISLGSAVTLKEGQLKAKERELKELMAELDRRDRRIEELQRMYSVLEQSRSKVRERELVEKRDMHYNMAVVYARDGRYKDAEREYLRALEIDPSDAESHFNLGVLYEQSFKDKQKAARHYRKYLELCPGGEDVDTVRRWLREIEMETK
jgi:tetratricopeptide (TPR) repeat protein